ncbi:hypothetical protein K466DRAFT_603786 [Polyporus arcularius HHB13444]|uniref:BTB domain-containing protein n=1 Tax=Polyporus arcularius HHB13444 TaxID=1314778 RepID=A0A5C3P138_9APHY|nr:hypothetical protein K466DRAFT_603786 [Polyporus arcularius HHB13444]
MPVVGSSHSGNPTRHPIYYLPGADLVLRLTASNILYRLPSSYLVLDSACFESMLSLHPSDIQEGRTDDKPLDIPGITSAELECFLDFQLRHRLPRNDQAALTTILRLGHFFQYEAAQIEAAAALEQLPSFDAISKYVLGLKMGIRRWVMGGFSELVSPGAQRPLTREEVERLELMPYHAIMETRANVEAHRRSIAYCIPPMAHVKGCPDEINCGLAWKLEWKNKVAPHLMHPEEAVSGQAVLTMLENKDIQEVHPACRLAMVDRMKASGVLTHEDRIVERALQYLAPPE